MCSYLWIKFGKLSNRLTNKLGLKKNSEKASKTSSVICIFMVFHREKKSKFKYLLSFNSDLWLEIQLKLDVADDEMVTTLERLINNNVEMQYISFLTELMEKKTRRMNVISLRCNADRRLPMV